MVDTCAVDTKVDTPDPRFCNNDAPFLTTIGGIVTLVALVLFLVGVRQTRPVPTWVRRGYQGIVTFAHRAYNQDDVLVAHCKRASLQRKRPTAM